MTDTEISQNGPQVQANQRAEEILAVAERFFAERGYRQTDVQQIADALGVGKGTIYRCFPTKEDLFLRTVDRAMRRLQERLACVIETETDTMKRILLGVRTYLGFFDENPQVIELLIQERAEFRDRKKPTYLVYRENDMCERCGMVEQLMDAGQLRKMPPEKMLDFIGNLLYGTMFTCHYQGKRPLVQYAEEIVDILMHGILPRRESTSTDQLPAAGCQWPEDTTGKWQLVTGNSEIQAKE